MKIHYYPGCTLKQKTTALDISTREAMKRLDIELVEPEGWTCCGAEYPLTEEKIAGLAAPIRVLRQVRDEGGDVLVTTCSFCFAVLKRADKAIKDDPLKHKRINAFLRDDIQIIASADDLVGNGIMSTALAERAGQTAVIVFR